jgi:elongation factor P
MASMIEAIEIKRKMYFEYENAPYHCLDVDVSKPTARGGQTLVRVKMRNLLTRAVFDRTFKAGEKFHEPDLARLPANYLYEDASGYNFMDQATFETLTLNADTIGDDRYLLADNVNVQIQTYNGRPIAIQFPPHVELTVTSTEAGRARRHGERQRHQAGDSRNRPRNPGAALHQRGREDQGPYGDARVCRARVIPNAGRRFSGASRHG